ncbi:hypothetical protein BP6252_08201 [Coleophoma cylindrospora]|uniref:Zn(2)-C6 fungal-type domain-containing protein n=1 Tax=Coleophoma cylindrospora TaxID=1849047 RepID=A0A3D8RCJ0_9HELO|nr:hypothetical protein BP6252_08201 [Coleophoma cylindrospora]
MSQDESTPRRVRNGAKSCAECRRRKVRCIWPTAARGSAPNDRDSCRNCATHGRSCVPQLVRSGDSDHVRPTARDRIERLEREVALLTGVVRDQNALPSPRPQQIGAGDNTYSDELEMDRAPISGATGPSHLRFLFNNFLVNTPENEKSKADQQSSRLLEECMNRARLRLQSLIPTREEVTAIATYASAWMPLYHALFAPICALESAEQLIVYYDQAHDSSVQPVALAMFLLSVAITVQQVPPDDISSSFYKGLGTRSFVEDVSRAVDATIVANSAIAGTVQGLETTMLIARLQLGRGNIQAMWLTLRKAIALAELIGLPKARYSAELTTVDDGATDNSRLIAGQTREVLQAKAALWDAICATDRNSSMMFNLPACTIMYAFPLSRSIMREGQVSPQAYNFQLSTICALIHEIDESYVLSLAETESYEKVLNADRHLRALAATPPKSWWQGYGARSVAEQMVQFWHHYLLARIHLRPAMIDDSDDHHSPGAGQSSSYPGSETDSSPVESLGLVDKVIDAFKFISNKAGSDFACEAITALNAIKALFVKSHDPIQPGSVTIHIPMLGEIRIVGARNQLINESTNKDNRPPLPSDPFQNTSARNGTSEIDPYSTNNTQDTNIFSPWSLELINASSWFPSSTSMSDFFTLDQQWMDSETVATTNYNTDN